MSGADDSASDAMADVNADMSDALGYDPDRVAAVQPMIFSAAKQAVIDFALTCKTELGVAPCTAAGSLMQASIHALIQFAPGGPVLDHLRTLCDVIERDMAGKPPLPAHMQRLEKLGIAVSLAARRKSEGGGGALQ